MDPQPTTCLPALFERCLLQSLVLQNTRALHEFLGFNGTWINRIDELETTRRVNDDLATNLSRSHVILCRVCVKTKSVFLSASVFFTGALLLCFSLYVASNFRPCCQKLNAVLTKAVVSMTWPEYLI